MGFSRHAAVRTVVVGAIAAGTMLATLAPASAATGTLTVSGSGGFNWSVKDPGVQCYPVPRGAPELVDVVNNTDEVAFVYGNDNCASDRDTEINPGGKLSNYSGAYSFRFIRF